MRKRTSKREQGRQDDRNPCRTESEAPGWNLIDVWASGKERKAFAVRRPGVEGSKRDTMGRQCGLAGFYGQILTKHPPAGVERKNRQRGKKPGRGRPRWDKLRAVCRSKISYSRKSRRSGLASGRADVMLEGDRQGGIIPVSPRAPRHRLAPIRPKARKTSLIMPSFSLAGRRDGRLGHVSWMLWNGKGAIVSKQGVRGLSCP